MGARRRGPLLVVALALIALSLLAACSGDDDSSPDPTPPAQPEGLLRLGVVGLDTLDPAAAIPTDQVEIIAADLLHDGLTAPGPDGVGAVPALASALEPDADHRVWTVRLRPDATFGEGTPVRAADVKASLERVAARGPESIAGSRLDLIDGYRDFAVDRSTPDLAGVAVVDDITLTVTLRDPYVELPELLTSPLYGIVPATADEAFFRAPQGSGPFRVDADDGTTLTLVPRTGPAAAGVSLTGVELVRFPGLTASYAAFEAGAVDWTLLPPEAVEGAEVRWGGRYAPSPFGAELWLGFDLRDPAYQDLRFRQAMTVAVDRAAVVDEVLPGRLPLDGLVPVGVPGASTAPGGACGEGCAYDPDRARALLVEAFPDGDVPTIELDTYDDATQRALVEAVKADFEAVGIPVVADVRPLAEYQISGLQGRDLFSLGWVGLVATQESYLGPLFLSGSPDDVTGFSSPEVDAAIVAARATVDGGAREQQYAQIEQAVLAESPLIPLAQLVTHQVVGERVSGFVSRLDGSFQLAGLTVAD